MDIRTISTISLWDSRIPLHNVALRQGDLDGACGPYSLMMALLLSKVITVKKAKELWNGEVDGRTKFARAVKELDALVTKGTTIKALNTLFDGIQKIVGTAKIKNLQMTPLHYDALGNSLQGTPLLTAVRQHIADYGHPVILFIDWNTIEAHWVVAVGYQTHDDNKLEHILILDPASQTGKIDAWNAILGKTPKKRGSKSLHFISNNGDWEDCSVSQGIGFVPTTQSGTPKKAKRSTDTL